LPLLAISWAVRSLVSLHILSLFFSQLKTKYMEHKHIDVYQIVTDQIIELLEQDIIPWKKPWMSGLPKNLISKKPYRGINIMLLNSLGYKDNYFLTFDQVKKIGGSVKRGEKSHLVVFWKWIEGEAKEGEEKKTRKPILIYYRVFNVEQCTGIHSSLVPAQVTERYPIAACDSIIERMPDKPKIQYKENEAYYHPKEDFINMPDIEYFVDSEAYYATFFHELVHSTGHTDRLNRKEIVEPTRFGTYDYSSEELVAEIGSCYLQTVAGIFHSNISNSAAYIQGWLGKLKNDKRCIVLASGQAQRAVDYILSVKGDMGDTVEEVSELQAETA
jgi:antirestriction protein ArdC